MRREVEWFANHMERKLQQNDHKGGWDQDSMTLLYDRMCQEITELQDVMTQVELYGRYDRADWLIEEAADVANFAMMLADKAYKLHAERTNTPSPEAGDGQAETGSN